MQYIADKVSTYKEAKVSLEDHYMEVELDNDDGDEDDPEKNTEIGFLKQYYKITQKVPEEKWIEVESGLEIHLKIDEAERSADKETATGSQDLGITGMPVVFTNRSCQQPPQLPPALPL